MFKCTVIKREMPNFKVRGLFGLIYKLIFTVFFLSFRLAPSLTHTHTHTHTLHTKAFGGLL